MPAPSTAPSRRRHEGSEALLPHQQVLLAGGLLIAVQLGFRAWALLPSWFYTDDYRFLYDATGAPFSLDYLLEPFDNQFMPLGRALVWLVADSGHVNWTLAASLTLVLQALASVACLWMLTTLFGHRWAVLAPLGLYLFGAMTMPALMWWAAALNQLPLQAVLFAAVGCWVRYLRGEGGRWLLLTLVVLAVGLLAYVKTVLVFLVLAYLLLAYFVEGGPLRRTWSAVRRFWPAALAAVALGGGYSAYYLTQVPSIFQDADRPVAGDLAETMLGSSFTTGVLGGPWRWSLANAPVAQAAPPPWSVHLSWALLAVGLVLLALLRRRTGRAWVLLAGYLAAAYVLVLVSRAPVAGGFIGAEYRYLTDVAALLPLVIGLATLPLLGSRQGSELRDPPLLLVRPGPRLLALLAVAVCVSGLLSSRAYAQVWHERHPGDDYVQRVRAELAVRGTVDLADQVVPAEVIPGFSAPYNSTGRLVPLLDGDVRFPEVSSRLMAFDEDSRLGPAGLDVATTSREPDDEQCGWEVDEGAVTVPLEGRTFDYEWWVRIDYLATEDTDVLARMGETERRLPLRRGLHSVWARADGAFSSVTLADAAPGTSVCVQEVAVGQVVPEDEEEQ